jgi:peptidoglycan/LPS O-acetylase OafA/YrhL
MTPHASAVVRPEHTKAAAVEFWRFAFTVLVCLFHLEVNYRQTLLTSGSSAVEFFFVLSGFLIAMSASRRFSGSPEPVTAREARDKAVAFVVKKLRVIYPILIFVLLYVITINYRLMGSTFDKLQFLQNTEWELLLLTGTPLGYNNGLSPVIPLWFLTVLLLVGYVMTYVVYRHNDFMKFAAPVAGLLFYIYFALNSSTILDQPLRMGFTTAGMIRGISEMSFGVALFYLYEYLSVKQLGRFWRVLLSLAELYAIYRFFA